MKITATNYAAHKPDRASLTDAEQAGYDLIEMGGLDLYGQDADITEAIDLYLVELNHKYISDFKKGKIMLPEEEPAPAAKGKKKRPSVAQRKASGKKGPARAKAPFKLRGNAGAENLALECELSDEGCIVKARCNGEPLFFFLLQTEGEPTQVWAVADEGDDLNNPPKVNFNKLATKRASLYGEQIVKFYDKATYTQQKNQALIDGRAKHNRTVNENKAAARAVSQRHVTPRPGAADVVKSSRPAPAAPAAAAPAGAPTSLARLKVSLKVGQKVRLTNYHHTKLSRETVVLKSQSNSFATAKENGGTGEAIWMEYPKAAQYDVATQTFLDDAGKPFLKVELIAAYSSAAAPAGKAAKARKQRPTVAQRKASGKIGPARAEKPHVTKELPILTEEQHADVEKMHAQERKPVAPGTRTKAKKEKAAKGTKAKKEKPVDTRTPVAHFDADTVFMQSFLKMEGKPATFAQVKALHVKMEKAIAQQRVRAASKYAEDIDELAGLVARLLAHMKKEEIGSTDKLTFNNPVVARVQRHVEQLRIDGAMNLLSRYINLQGTVPTEKQVHSLAVALHNELQEHPKGDHSLAMRAAHAVLEGWKPGQTIGITKQQLGRLAGLSGAGLGCPDTPSKPCGCSKKASALSGAPADPAAPYRGQPASAPAAAPLSADDYPAWQQEEDEADEEEEEDDLFSTLGEKSKSKPPVDPLPLPGPLGQFIGPIIERHEWAMVLRGEKGAGKTRLQYQILNMFAGMGLSCALFTLEIDKDANIVTKMRDTYIAPSNRARVKAASEAPGGMAAIEAAAQRFDVVAVDSWNKIPGAEPDSLDKMRKKYKKTLFVAIYQSTTAGTARGGVGSEYDAAAVCQVVVPGIAHMEKNRYATGPADALQWNVMEQKLIGTPTA